MAIEISIVLVSWNDAEDLEAAVASLASARQEMASGGPRVSLVVVGNGPGSVRSESLLAAWPEAKILLNAETRGFAPAANQAAAAASGYPT